MIFSRRGDEMNGHADRRHEFEEEDVDDYGYDQEELEDDSTFANFHEKQDLQEQRPSEFRVGNYAVNFGMNIKNRVTNTVAPSNRTRAYRNNQTLSRLGPSQNGGDNLQGSGQIAVADLRNRVLRDAPSLSAQQNQFNFANNVVHNPNYQQNLPSTTPTAPTAPSVLYNQNNLANNTKPNPTPTQQSMTNAFVGGWPSAHMYPTLSSIGVIDHNSYTFVPNGTEFEKVVDFEMTFNPKSVRESAVGVSQTINLHSHENTSSNNIRYFISDIEVINTYNTSGKRVGLHISEAPDVYVMMGKTPNERGRYSYIVDRKKNHHNVRTVLLRRKFEKSMESLTSPLYSADLEAVRQMGLDIIVKKGDKNYVTLQADSIPYSLYTSYTAALPQYNDDIVNSDGNLYHVPLHYFEQMIAWVENQRTKCGVRDEIEVNIDKGTIGQFIGETFARTGNITIGIQLRIKYVAINPKEN